MVSASPATTSGTTTTSTVVLDTYTPNGPKLGCLMSDEPSTGPGLGDLEKELVCSVCP